MIIGTSFQILSSRSQTTYPCLATSSITNIMSLFLPFCPPTLQDPDVAHYTSSWACLGINLIRKPFLPETQGSLIISLKPPLHPLLFGYVFGNLCQRLFEYLPSTCHLPSSKQVPCLIITSSFATIIRPSMLQAHPSFVYAMTVWPQLRHPIPTELQAIACAHQSHGCCLNAEGPAYHLSSLCMYL